MKNRRLLTILIIFIIIGTFAVLGSALFAIRTVNVQFTNQFEFIHETQEEQLEADLRESILGFTKKRNAIFGINRKKITETIEQANTRVRVTNIEVKFPNKLEIKVRERYPVFKLHFGDGDTTAVMCGDLRVLDVLNAEAFNELETKKAKWPFIEIPDEIGAGLKLDDLQVGEYLTKLETEDTYTKILKKLTPFFARLSTHEDAICNIFENISFGGTPGDLRLIMKARAATSNTYHKNHFDFIVHNAEYRLEDKLIKGWQALEKNNTKPGVYQVWEQTTYVVNDSHGTKLEIKVPDGILVTYRAFYEGERG